MTSENHSPLRPLLAACLVAVALGGCSGLGESGSGGNTLSNMFFYGGPTVPPEAPEPTDDIDCPSVIVREGGAAIRVGGDEASSVRHQISLNNVARECVSTGNGGYALKIGVEGLALLGPAGGGTRSLTAPVRFTVRRGDQIIADRTRQVQVSIPTGQSQATFVAIEEGIAVGPGDVPTVEVGLGAGPARPAARRPRG